MKCPTFEDALRRSLIEEEGQEPSSLFWLLLSQSRPCFIMGSAVDIPVCCRANVIKPVATAEDAVLLWDCCGDKRHSITVQRLVFKRHEGPVRLLLRARIAPAPQLYSP